MMTYSQTGSLRHNWTLKEVNTLLNRPFNDLLFDAQMVHRQNFKANQVQVSTLLSIKTGACPEDCAYCPQSAHFNTKLERQKLLEVEAVIEKAKAAKAAGSERFCMGAAWRSPNKRDMPYVLDMIKGVKELGLETCMTLGMLDSEKAQSLADAGLDYYNHNLDTSAEYYEKIISTRTYDDRLDTLENVREAGIKVCSGGILGMGESQKDRAGLLISLANLPTHPESVPINQLVKVAGTPLENVEDLDPLEFVKIIAVARIMMPKSYIRLSAGREEMSDEMQAMCFFAGANSIFYGECLLTTPNPAASKDQILFERLGINRKHTVTQAPAELTEILAKETPSGSESLFYNAAV